MLMQIGDTQVPAVSGATIPVYNPATGACIDTIPAGDTSDVDRAVSAAESGQKNWATTDPLSRSRVLYRAAQSIRDTLSSYATLLTREQGKPFQESRNEIQGFCRVLEYYASIGGMDRGTSSFSEAYGHAIVAREPIGICGAVIPWNMPALIMGWKAGPALITGNAIIIKPATSAPLTCLALGQAFYAAGLPPGVLSVVTGRGGEAGEAVIAHPAIDAVSFTGEVTTGARVAAIAGPMMKRMTLELGGSDPMIVCSDADLSDAARGAVRGRFYNCGQTCTAVKRLIVMEDIYDRFLDMVLHEVQALILGNGLDTGVTMGPLNNRPAWERVRDTVIDTLDSGSATLLAGGRIPANPDLNAGFFYEPTLLTNVDHDAIVMKEEVFGPVLPVIPASDLSYAIQIANDTRFGLGASIWTKNTDTIKEATNRLKTGIVWVNQHLKIPPQVPFGGVKASGIGRENGYDALRTYYNEKTILIRP